jgi:hypothetical protein
MLSTIEVMIFIASGASFRHHLFSGHDFSMAKNSMDCVDDLNNWWGSFLFVSVMEGAGREAGRFKKLVPVKI